MQQEGGRMKKVGVLALQGGVEEHMKKLSQLSDVEPVSVKYLDELENVDALIIPGGESTALGLLLKEFKLLEPLRERIQSGMPVWGTCAGMIILAKELSDDATKHLAVMDIKVKRNAYGTQLESFSTEARINAVTNDPIPLVFIRAPFVEGVGKEVEIMLKIDEKVVACRQQNMLATSFHPELTNDLNFHKYFVNMI
jgi:5'-phosphate synthase pdxT subunit